MPNCQESVHGHIVMWSVVCYRDMVAASGPLQCHWALAHTMAGQSTAKILTLTKGVQYIVCGSGLTGFGITTRWHAFWFYSCKPAARPMTQTPAPGALPLLAGGWSRPGSAQASGTSTSPSSICASTAICVSNMYITSQWHGVGRCYRPAIVLLG
jgi:hypothetical protein